MGSSWALFAFDSVPVNGSWGTINYIENPPLLLSSSPSSSSSQIKLNIWICLSKWTQGDWLLALRLLRWHGWDKERFVWLRETPTKWHNEITNPKTEWMMMMEPNIYWTNYPWRDKEMTFISPDGHTVQYTTEFTERHKHTSQVTEDIHWEPISDASTSHDAPQESVITFGA